MKSCIITSASNKFFPSVLNLIGSIKANYPEHPPIYVYNLGLFFTFKRELASIPGVTIVTIPHFIGHWRSCYTWKTYIFDNPLADLNLYLDAGTQVLRPLYELFNKIEKNGYMIVSAGNEARNRDLIPEEFATLFDLNEDYLNKGIVTAGMFGFKNNHPQVKVLTKKLYAAGKAGLTLGFSASEQWKNKGVNKNDFIRNARLFRHDNTLLCALIANCLPEAIIEPLEDFDIIHSTRPTQYIWNLRLNYQKLDYLFGEYSSEKSVFIKNINKLFLHIFLLLKEINRKIKGHHY